MSGNQYKIGIFILLSVLFCSYSIMLYLSKPQEQQKANHIAQKGKQLWQEKNCVSCHQLYGLGGHLGPDLTNVYSLREEALIKAFLKYGTPVMPDLKLTDDEVTAFVAFFKYTNTTGSSDPRTFTKHYNGNISQQ